MSADRSPIGLAFQLTIFTLLISWSIPASSQTPYSTWMGEPTMWATIKDKPLRDIVIAGSHDSGTYDLDPDFFGNNPAGTFIKELCEFVCLQYAQAQSIPIYEQLHAGARFFDLRFVHVFNVGTAQDEYRIHHSYLGPTKEEIFADILRYLEEPGHEKEIITLKISQLLSIDGGDFSLEDHETLLGTLTPFKDYMVAKPANGYRGVTPQNIVFDNSSGADVATGKQLIVYYPNSRADPENPDCLVEKLTKVTQAGCPKVHSMFSEYGATENLLWSGSFGDWMGSAPLCERAMAVLGEDDSDCGDSSYPDPSLYQSEDLLANVWLINMQFSYRNEAFITALPFGLDNPLQMIRNLLSPIPGDIGWGSLEAVSSFTNPRMVPHIIARPRGQVNVVTADYFHNSGLMAEVIKLNKEPARVTIRLNAIEINPDSGACGVNLEDCDFYPVFNINGNDSEEPTDQFSAQHQRGRVIDDEDNVYRGTHYPEDNFWTYTVAVPWDQPLLAYLQIWDDDTNSDDLVDFAFFDAVPTDILQTLKSDQPNGPIFYKQRIEKGLFGSRVAAEICVESWDRATESLPCTSSNLELEVRIGIAEGRLGAFEGGELNFTGDVALPPGVVLPSVQSFTLDWAIDGIPSARSSVRSVQHTFTDNGFFRIHLSSTAVFVDGTTLEGSLILELNVKGIAPVAQFTDVSGDIDQGQSVTLALSAPFDPSTNDTAAGFIYTYDCGNGAASAAGGITASSFVCSYPEPGQFTATATIADKDGESTSYESIVTVADTIAPVVIAPPDVSVAAYTFVEDEIGVATATDNFDVSVNVVSNQRIAFFPAGQNIVTWSATDSAGNVGYATQIVTARKSGGGAFGLLELMLLVLVGAVRYRCRDRVRGSS